uniref:(northern house mosquito) hypothetical protein n=1 Tax=Culex pipiens TaxID=7175 RepID=A0A8D8PKQ0_CULPI
MLSTPTPTSASHLCWPKTPSSSFVLGPENSDAHALCSCSLGSWAPHSPLPDFPPESLRQCSSSLLLYANKKKVSTKFLLESTNKSRRSSPRCVVDVALNTVL